MPLRRPVARSLHAPGAVRIAKPDRRLSPNPGADHWYVESCVLPSERHLQDLVGRLLVAQEEERHRVAYEVHDGLAQVAASAHQHLQAYARYHRPRSPEARQQLARALELAQRTVREARGVVANLRPTTLDDFGLGEGRLAAPVETALYRVVQEALT